MRPIQQPAKSSQLSLSGSNGSAQQFSTSMPKPSATMPPRHQHSSSVTSDRPTAHAPPSTTFDAIQAAHAAQQGDRAISSSGSSKPSVMSYGADGRSTPDTQQVRDGSASARQGATPNRPNGTQQAKGRKGSRDRAREQGLTIRSKDSMNNGGMGEKNVNVSKHSEPHRRNERGGEGGQENELSANSRAPGGRVMAAPQISPVKPLSPMAAPGCPLRSLAAEKSRRGGIMMVIAVPFNVMAISNVFHKLQDGIWAPIRCSMISASLTSAH